MKLKKNVDMLNGDIFSNVLLFALPLIASGVIQLLFNAIDMIVVGKYSGSASMAAVSSTGSLINLVTNLFIGLSVGSSVAIAKRIGNRDIDAIHDAVHTSMAIAFIAGSILTIIGIVFSKSFLVWMKSPEDVIDLSTLYLRFYFSGMLGTFVYNFASAILRAKGDTRRPLIALTIAGALNALLNLFFVVVLKMDVAGVGLATVISQIISAIAVLIILIREKDDFKLNLRKLHINRMIFTKIVKIGLPAGFQGIMFSFSNVIIQSSVNTFGAIMIAGNSAAINLESFIYTAMNGFSQGALTFCSQNMGAGRTDRIKKIVWISQGAIVVIGAVLGAIFLLFGTQLLGIFSTNPEVIKAGMSRLWIIFTTYFLCGMMDGMANSIRGIGHSLMPVISSLIGACLFRIIWLFTIFLIPQFHTPTTIFLSYPISWILTFIANVVFYNKYMKELK